ncbi:autophagy-related protein 2 homolog B-like isoform X2 [Dysidea avara]|uniref:autophagy-related protein 2 homolog B-like isoform X2 n=1 Tax=Dysidea avara TaxID=196820 RepID=UPI00331E902D
MPWGWFKWPEFLKKKACRYLLQHYLGKYLETKISLDDLTVDLYNGTATVSNVPLSAEVLNESLQNTNAPVRIVSGCIGEVKLTIPWKALIRDNCQVQISGLKLVITPQVFSNYTAAAAASMTESLLFSTMSTSLHVAEELMKTKSGGEEAEPAGYEGMEAFARAIEIVLARVKVSLTDTVIQVNYETANSSKLFLRLKVERIDFYDERSRLPSDEEAEVTVTDIAIKILELNKPVLEFGHEPCEQDHINPSPMDTVTTRYPYQQQLSSDKSLEEVETAGVVVGKAAGRMEVKVKVKQTETVAGPKLEIEGFLSAVHFLFSQEDLLLLIEMIDGIIKSSGSSQSHVVPHRHNIPGFNRPMQTRDHNRIEQQLQRHVEQNQRSERFRHDPWDIPSSGGDSGDDFHSLEINSPAELISSVDSIYSDASASIYKSTWGQIPESPQSPGFIQKPFADPTRKINFSYVPSDRSSPASSQRSYGSSHDTSVYKFTVSCFTFALLHRKPHYEDDDDNALSSIKGQAAPSINDNGRLSPMAYFESMSQAVLAGRTLKGSDPNDKISQALPLDHLLLSAQTVNISVTTTGPSTKLHLSVGSTNVREYIYHNRLSHITKPVAINSLLSLIEDTQNIKPAIELDYSFTEDPDYKKKYHRFGKQLGGMPEAKLSVVLHSVHIEIDPTLLERVNFLNNLPSFSRQSSNLNSFENEARSLYLPMSNIQMHKQDYFDAAMEDSSSIKTLTTIVLTCNALDIVLKFPVPDMRDEAAITIRYHSKLRQELCYVDVTSLSFSTCFNHTPKLIRYEVQLKTLKAYLSASGHKEDKHLFLVVKSDQDVRGYTDQPRLVMEIQTVVKSQLEDDPCAEEKNSLDDYFMPSFNKKPSPFATSKTMFEFEADKTAEWKEEVMPGSREEMRQFEEHAKDHSSYVLKCFLPVLKIHLPNQQFFSTLNNRFGQDLPLWQSSLSTRSDQSAIYTPSTSVIPVGDPLTDTIRPHLINPQPSSFKPLHREGGSSEEDDDEEHTSLRPGLVVTSEDDGTPSTTSTTVLSLVVGKGQLSLCTALPVIEVISVDADKKEKLVDVDSPKRRTSYTDNSTGGIAVFDVTQIMLTSVSGYDGDPTLDYLCLQIDKLSLGHYSKADMSQFSTYSCVSDSSADVEKLLYSQLLPVVGPAPSCMLVSGDSEAKREPMLSIAMEMKSDTSTNTKTNTCSIAVRNGMLKYFVTPSQYNCFVQLAQFFNTENEDIVGYDPQPVITALHVHFLDSTIVYRPKYLPWSIAYGISAGHFSTTLTTSAKVSIMRLIIDESYFFLTNKPEKNLDLKQDYVCVIEMGLLELIIKMPTGDLSETQDMPEISLEFSNNLVELRTCVDTCAALRDLMQYIASHGDLREEDLRDYIITRNRSCDSGKDDGESQDSFSTPLNSLTADTTVPLPGTTNQLDLMDEAMEELAIENTGSKATNRTYRPAKEKRRSPSSKRRHHKKTPLDDKEQLTNPNLKSIKVPVVFSDSEDDSLGSKPLTGRHKLPMSPGRSSISSNMTSEESEDDFLILDMPTSSRMAKGAKPIIKSYLTNDERVKINNNHFAPSNAFTDQLHRPDHFPIPVTLYTLKDMTLVWYLYGGSDFSKSSTSPSPVSSSCEHSSSPATKHRDFHPRQDVSLSSSPVPQPSSLKLHSTSPVRSPVFTRRQLNNDGSKHKRSSSSNSSETMSSKKLAHKNKMLSWKIAGGPERDHDTVMEIHINKLRLQHEVYPEDKEQSMRFVLLIREVELVDRLVSSQLNKFLSQYVSNTMPKQTHANMVSFKMLSIRTELEEYPSREEVIVHVSALPLRLYVDQDAFTFLYDFITGLSTTKSAESPSTEMIEQHSPSPDLTTDTESDVTVDPTYFKEFSFYPSLVVKIDYEAKRFDMDKGVISGILIGLSHLDSAEIELKSIKLCGVLGWDRLLSEVINVWTSDVKSQLPKILGGVGPMHYLMQFAQGVVDFVWLPVHQYQQDGRVVRGLQKGAGSLATSTGMATVELTTRLVQTIEFLAATTYDFVAPVDRNSLALARRRNPRRPQDFRSGVSSAWNTLATGFGDTAGDLYNTVTREHEDGGVARTLGEVLRQVPGVVVRPILIASEATRHVLGGMRNQLMPDARKEELAKYRDDT